MFAGESTCYSCVQGIAFVLLLCHAAATPLGGQELQRDVRQITDQVLPMDFLMDYGYLSEEFRNSTMTMHDDRAKKALKKMQRYAGIPVTGVMDKATSKMMHSSRCGMPDMEAGKRYKRYAFLGNQKWPVSRPITWTLRDRQNTGNVPAEGALQTLKDALGIWQSHSGIRFREVSEQDDADINVYFVRGRHHQDRDAFDGRGMVLAHAYSPGTGIGGDAHFDADEDWSLEARTARGTNLFATAVHEFGHSLGLGHSSQGTVMYAYQTINYRYNVLPTDDRMGIQKLYGAAGQGAAPAAPDVPAAPRRPAKGTPRYYTWYSQRRRAGKGWGTTYSYTSRWSSRQQSQTAAAAGEDQQSPDTCVEDYDDIFMVRGALFILKGTNVWKTQNAQMQDGFPTTIAKVWPALPENVARVDAAYENPSDDVVFFVGRRYYVVKAGRTLRRSGDIADLGLPVRLDRVDAAMVWPENGHTYLFAGNMYWRFDEARHRVVDGYPKQIATGWQGVGGDEVDAVVPWTDGMTYFFKDKSYWKYGTDVAEHEELPEPLMMMCLPDSAGGRLTARFVLVYVGLATLQRILH